MISLKHALEELERKTKLLRGYAEEYENERETILNIMADFEAAAEAAEAAYEDLKEARLNAKKLAQKPVWGTCEEDIPF